MCTDLKQGSTQASRNEQPNIVVILSDDHGAWAMGCAGNDEIRTPNLDRVADQGMRFSSFFCTSPVCSPARASLMTGRIPSQHDVHDWIRDGNAGESAIQYLQGQTAYRCVGWRRLRLRAKRQMASILTIAASLKLARRSPSIHGRSKQRHGRMINGRT